MRILLLLLFTACTGHLQTDEPIVRDDPDTNGGNTETDRDVETSSTDSALTCVPSAPAARDLLWLSDGAEVAVAITSRTGLRWWGRPYESFAGDIYYVSHAWVDTVPTITATTALDVLESTDALCVIDGNGTPRCHGSDGPLWGTDVPPERVVSAGGDQTSGVLVFEDGTLLGNLEMPVVGPVVRMADDPGGGGYTTVCAVLADGSTQCWGDDPPSATGISGPCWSELAIDGPAWCGIDDEGALHCGHPDGPAAPLVADLPGGTGWRKVSLFHDVACAVDAEGRISCWGAALRLGDDAPRNVRSFLPDIPSGTGFGEVEVSGRVASNAAGGLYVAALVGCALHGEDVVCWGDPDDARILEVAEPMSAP